jgi:hypothetical protein
VGYSLQVVAGYLHFHKSRSLIMIVLGDQQPSAMVNGEDASWDVRYT